MTYEEICKKAESLLPTLTTTYYTKGFNGLTIKTSTWGTSHFNPSESEICISLGNIATAVTSAPSLDGERNIEKAVRGQLYHELSHAILTPTNCVSFPSGLSYGDFNLIEDERIETILARYYLDVDFKWQIKAICPFPTEGVKTWEQFFFFAVRHRRAPYKQAEINEAVNNFIVGTKDISSVTTDTKAQECFLAMNLALKEFIYSIWLEYQAKTEGKKSSGGDGKGEGDGDGGSEDIAKGDEPKEADKTEDGETAEGEPTKGEPTEGGDGEATEGDDELTEGEDGEDGESGSGESIANGDEKDGKKAKASKASKSSKATGKASGDEDAEPEDLISAKDADEIMEKALKEMEALSDKADSERLTSKSVVNEPAYTQMLKIIARNVGIGLQKHSVLYGYSGKISSRRIANDYNDSYKWFAKNTSIRSMSASKTNKKVLNLWLDQSGSFADHDCTINAILAGLNRLEKERDDFEWNLIRVDDHFVLETNKERRGSYSRGGNLLPKAEIEDCYRKTNKTGKEVNIVLFDGRVGVPSLQVLQKEYPEVPLEDLKRRRRSLKWMGDCGDDYDGLAVLNNRRTIFIAQGSNIEPLKEVCPNALEIIEENTNYEGKLADNIVKALDMLF